MFDPNDFTARTRYDLIPYGHNPYGVTQERSSPLAIIARQHPETAIALAQTLGRIKHRHEATLGAIAQARDVIMNAGAALLEEVHRNGIGERGITVSAEAFVTVPGTTHRGWFRTYGPEVSRAGFRLTIERL